MLCRNYKPMIITGDYLCDGCDKPPDGCPRITEGDCGPCVKEMKKKNFRAKTLSRQEEKNILIFIFTRERI